MRKAPLTLCVVGGGFTGAAAAIACLARLDQPFRLVVVEPSGSLGRGLAYGAHHPLHLLNVRTRDLSVRAGQPGDFLNWAFRQLDQGENAAETRPNRAGTNYLSPVAWPRRSARSKGIAAWMVAAEFGTHVSQLDFDGALAQSKDISDIASGLALRGRMKAFQFAICEVWADAAIL